MPGAEFLDTNLLVYAYDASDPVKQRTAQDFLRRALGGDMVISPQVLAEFSATLLHKASRLVNPAEVAAILDALAPIKVVATDADIVRRAVEAHAKYGVHFYDGMIIASAERGRCYCLWSEDFNAGQEYFGVVAKNPFI